MWPTIILTILSFFVTKKSTGSTSRAALAAGLTAGVGYWATSDDASWGPLSTGAAEAKPVVDVNGNPVKDANGKPVLVNGGGTATTVDKLIDTTGKTLQSWGGTGTATVIGTTAVATNSSFSKWLPWLAVGGIGYLILK